MQSCKLLLPLSVCAKSSTSPWRPRKRLATSGWFCTTVVRLMIQVGKGRNKPGQTSRERRAAGPLSDPHPLFGLAGWHSPAGLVRRSYTSSPEGTLHPDLFWESNTHPPWIWKVLLLGGWQPWAFRSCLILTTKVAEVDLLLDFWWVYYLLVV